MRTKGRQALSLLVALLVSVVYLTPVLAQTPGCSKVITYYNWNVITPPKAVAGQKITDHAVDPTNADLIYATNGSVIGVSDDGGCTWEQPYPAGPGGTVPITIKTIDTPALNVAVVGLQRGPDVVGAPSIALTENGGKTWSEGGVGLPPTGTIEFLESPGDAQRVIFAGIDEGAGAADLLYLRNDNGLTWSLQSDLSAANVQMGIWGLAASPLDPDLMWAYGPGGLWQSRNAGRSFTEVPELAGKNVVAADVIQEQGEKARIMTLLGGQNQAWLSTNTGRNFNVMPTPGPGDSIDHGPSDWEFVITAQGRTYLYVRAVRGWVDLQAPVPDAKDVGGIRGLPTPSLAVHTDNVIQLFRASPERRGGPIDEAGVNVSLNQPPPLAVKDATFGPPGKEIYLKAGEEKTIPYVLTIPPRRVPLDVYFLVDTSSSMKNTIDALAERLADITNALIAEKVDVQFGLAVYRSYPNSFPPRAECEPGQPSLPGAPCERNYVYEQVVDITRDTRLLEQGLENLVADAGGSYDAHLEALKATVTGEPVDLPPRGVENGYDVGAGEQAQFRDKSVRVVIHATDEAYGRGAGDAGNDPDGTVRNGPPPNIPPEGPIIDEFIANEVEHVGLSVGRLPYRDMVNMSRDIGTLASKDVDCDRNGVVDIPAGKPLVCKLFQEDLASEIPNVTPAVVGLLSAVQDRATVTLQAKHGGDVITEGQEVVKTITPNVYSDMVLQTANELPFEVTYACSKSQAGERFPVTIAPTSPEVPKLGSLGVHAKVICVKEKKDEEPPFLAALLPVPLVGLVVPPIPPPPPAPVTQLNPATQAQAQGQAQAAAATQEEEQPQLAYVTAYEEALENQFAMSAYESRRRGLPPGAALGIGAVSVSLMYGAGLALRRRTRVERARY